MKEDEKKDVKKDKPNESGNILLDEHIKIYDPNTKEVLINKRGE